MANWKLTPVHIEGNLFSITPEWTSGTGCYRVKRFSSVFPFVVNGEDLSSKVVYLLRWGSKLPAQDDMSVYFDLGDKIVHLFNSPAIVVEFFRRNWAGTEVADKLIYLSSGTVSRLEIGNLDCSLTDFLMAMNLFQQASKKTSVEVFGRNSAYASSLYEQCAANRKELASVVSTDELVARTLYSLPRLTDYIRNNGLTRSAQAKKQSEASNVLSATQVCQPRKKPTVRLQRHSILNPMQRYSPVEIPQEPIVDFVAGDIEFETDHVDVGKFTVHAFGVYKLVRITSWQKNETYLIARTLPEAKKLIRLVKESSCGSNVDMRTLQLKYSSGEELYDYLTLGRFNTSVCDLFMQVWEGTVIGNGTTAVFQESPVPRTVVKSLSAICGNSHSARTSAATCVA